MLVLSFRRSNVAFRIHWWLSTVLKISNRSVWNNVFWYLKVHICSENLFNSLCMEMQILLKIPYDKINVTKNALFFLSQPPTHHSFNFIWGFLCKLKHKSHLLENVCGVYHFKFHLVFIKVYFFVQQKAWTCWLLNPLNRSVKRTQVYI